MISFIWQLAAILAFSFYAAFYGQPGAVIYLFAGLFAVLAAFKYVNN